MRNHIPHPSKTFDLKVIYRQDFPYPDSIMQYIKNARTTPKFYTRLLKSCKFFYSKKNLTVPFKQYYNTSNGFVETKVFGSQRVIFNQFEIIPNNLWMLGKIKIHDIQRDFASNFFQKISISAIKRLKLMNQTITLDELQFITSDKLELINFNRVTILDKNKSLVPLENVVETFINTIEITIGLDETCFKSVVAKTASNIAKLVCASKLKMFVLNDLPDTFNFDEFSKFVPHLQNTCINLSFSSSISEKYIKKLDAYIDDSLKTGVTEVVPLYIIYPNQSNERYDALVDLQNDIYEKRASLSTYLNESRKHSF
uniref:Uncharacterized protein n=1 Tax=Panagrolaimus sp. PS1159 TaxID=55785 RepID=A0AC35F8H6_9BILA